MIIIRSNKTFHSITQQNLQIWMRKLVRMIVMSFHLSQSHPCFPWPDQSGHWTGAMVRTGTTMGATGTELSPRLRFFAVKLPLAIQSRSVASLLVSKHKATNAHNSTQFNFYLLIEQVVNLLDGRWPRIRNQRMERATEMSQASVSATTHKLRQSPR